MERGELQRGDSGLFNRSSSLVVAAHEIKSPLALLRQLALELDSNSLSATQKQTIISQMAVISERAMRLTNNITKSAGINQTSFPFEPINPNQICEDVIHELMPLYKALGREVRFEKRTRTPLVIANRDLLRRILLNFGDNALYYSCDQPVVFSISQVRSEVQLGLRDSGPIVARKDMHRAVGLPGRPESSGLGLEICEAFAKIMNGHINNTRHRDGMTFYVRLQSSTQLSLL